MSVFKLNVKIIDEIIRICQELEDLTNKSAVQKIGTIKYNNKKCDVYCGINNNDSYITFVDNHNNVSNVGKLDYQYIQFDYDIISNLKEFKESIENATRQDKLKLTSILDTLKEL